MTIEYAFARPISEDRTDGNRTIPEQTGMTLRDYFAAAVLNAAYEQHSGPDFFAKAARETYALADAMLTARKAVQS